MNQPFRFQHQNIVSSCYFTSMTASHAEEITEQQNSTSVLPTISVKAQKKALHLMSQRKQTLP